MMPETTPDIAALFAAAYRDFIVDGNAASGVYQPEKLLLRQLGEAIVEALAEKAGTDLASDVVRGLMSPQQVEKLAGIAEGANQYAHPSGDGNRHIPVTGAGDTARFLKSATAAGGDASWAALSKDDVGLDKVANVAPDKLPISEDTQAALDEKAGTDLASDVVPGLMSPQQVEKLAGIAEGANQYAHPSGDGNRHIPATGAGDTARFLKSATAAGGDASWAALSKDDVGLDKVANVAPDKLPISEDTQAALDEKAGLSGAETITDKVLKLPVIEGYTEGHATASGTSFSPDLAADTLFHYQTTGNATIALPAATVGKSFSIAITYGGAHSIAWSGTARKWPKGEVPAPTSAAGKIDVFSFICLVAGTWLAFPSGQDF